MRNEYKIISDGGDNKYSRTFFRKLLHCWHMIRTIIVSHLLQIRSEQMAATSEDLRTKAQIEYERLMVLHGEHPLVPRRKPMHELISTNLSHRTTQKNEAQAYDNIWKRFGSWEAIRDAPVE